MPLPEMISAIILAAGKGTRMKSDQAKVLHQVFFAPMIRHVLDAVMEIPCQRIVMVTGHQGEQVQAALADYPIAFARQEEQLGTAHAVLAAQACFRKEEKGVVMILCGDTPLVRAQTLRGMQGAHLAAETPLTVMTTELADPTNYGRILTDSQNHITGIVEEKDATPEQKKIQEVNAGIYCADIGFLFSALRRIGTGNKQKEFYLTDIVGIATSAGYRVNRFFCPDSLETLGVNSRNELAQAHAALQQRRNQELMAAGVTMLQPESIWIEKSVVIGNDTVLHPGVHLLGQTVIGPRCCIGPFSILQDCSAAAGVTVGPHSYLAARHLQSGECIPPNTRWPAGKGGSDSD